MDRRIVLPGQIPVSLDLLVTNKNAMVGVGKVIEAIFGTTTLLHGFACAPTTPSSLEVAIAPGQIFSLQNIDNTAFGALPADLIHQIVKQGLALDAQELACPAPGTVGYSINYLIQIAFTESDTDAALRTYYNADNPTQPFSGANNSGTPDATRRKAQAIVQAKAGVAATTNTQVTPAPDPGFVAAFVVTVDYGQTAIEIGDIVLAANAPFITETLQQKMSQAQGDARWLRLVGGPVTGPITLPGAPTNPNEAATKAYVDGLAGGIHALALGNVAVATTANIALTGEQTIDGVLTAGSRVLVKNQTNPVQNGIYTTAAGAWARTVDADVWAEATGALALVTGGGQAGSAWLSSGVSGGAVGTDAINWGPFFNAASFQAASAFLAGLAALSTAGVLVRKADGSAVIRSITGSGGITVTNPTGDGGNIAVTPNKASVAEVRAAADANKLLDAKTVLDAAASVDIVDAATVAFDMATFINAKLQLGATIGATRAMGAPANVVDGKHFKLEIRQDASGNRALTWHANYVWAGGVKPLLSTGANALDIVTGVGLSNGKVLCAIQKAVA